MRRVVLFTLAFVAVGLLCLRQPSGWLLIVAAGGATLAGTRGRGAGAWLIAAMWLLAGAAAGGWLYGCRQGTPETSVRSQRSVRGAAKGTVASYSERTLTGRRWVVDLVAPVRGRYLVQQAALRPNLVPGDLVLLMGRMVDAERALNLFEFDYRAHLVARGIDGVFEAEYVSPTGSGRTAMHVVPGWLAAVRYAIEEAIERTALPTEAKGVVAAILLGQKGGIPAYTRERFSNAGVAHLLAVSGLHLLCLVALVDKLTKPAGRLTTGTATVLKMRAAVAWLTAAFYLGLTGAPTSCCRAFIMLTGYLFARCLERDYDIWTWLSLSALAILAYRPEAVLEPGFQLSTCSVAAIACTLQTVVRRGWFRELWDRHAPGLSAVRGAVLATATVAIVSTAAFLGTMPIVWWHFNVLPGGGIAANLAAVPLVSVVILPLCVLLMAPAVGLQCVGPLVEWPLHHAFILLDSVIDTAGADGLVCCPMWPGITAAVTGTAALLAALCLRQPRLRVVALIAGLACLAGPPMVAQGTRGTLLHQFHSGEGDALLITDRSGTVVLVDGGRRGTGKRALLPYIKKMGIERIDLLVISHGHSDHWSGVAEIAQHLTVGEIVTAPDGEALAVAEALAARFRGSTRVRAVSRGWRWSRGDTLLHSRWPPTPPTPRCDTSNDGSLVLFLETSDVVVVLPGDVEGDLGAMRADILAGVMVNGRGAVGASDIGGRALPLVFKAPHHGHKAALLVEMLVALSPDVVLVPARGPRVWWRGFALAGRGLVSPPPIYVTGIDGAITMSFSNDR